MEQARIHRRLLELGVALGRRRRSSAPTAGAARLACVHTRRERGFPATPLVLVTARLPEDALAEELLARRAEWGAAGVLSVRAVGDAWAPGTIATAVWDGRRFAEELDGEARRRGAVPARGGRARARAA